jgi:hypothetical protein
MEISKRLQEQQEKAKELFQEAESDRSFKYEVIVCLRILIGVFIALTISDLIFECFYKPATVRLDLVSEIQIFWNGFHLARSMVYALVVAAACGITFWLFPPK